MGTEWSMARRGDACVACQRRFVVGEPFAVFLYEAAAGYERREYCEQCHPAPGPEPIAVWKTHRPSPAAKHTQAFDREMIYGIFERLEDAAQPQHVQFRFVLALLLWRKKVLRLERTVAVDARETWEFVAVQTGVAHRVVHPDADERQLEHLSAQLEQLLAGQPSDLAVLAADPLKEETDG